MQDTAGKWQRYVSHVDRVRPTPTGVMGAWQDSLPMIVISGQVRYAVSVPQSGLKLRYRGTQEYEIIPTVKNMTKYAVMLTDPLAVKRESGQGNSDRTGGKKRTGVAGCSTGYTKRYGGGRGIICLRRG